VTEKGVNKEADIQTLVTNITNIRKIPKQQCAKNFFTINHKMKVSREEPMS